MPIADIVGRGWDDVLGAVDKIVSIPDVDSQVSEAAAAELAEPVEEDVLETEPETVDEADEPETAVDEDAGAARAAATRWCSAPTTTSGRRSASTRSGS